MTLDFLKGSAIVGALVGFWDQIKAFLWKILSVVIERVEINTEEAHDAIIAYLVANYKRYNTYDKSFGAMNESLRNGKYGLVPYEKFGTTSIIFQDRDKRPGKWFKWPFLFNAHSDSKNQQGGARHSENASRVYSTITCIRGTLNVDEIVRESTQNRNKLSWQADNEDEKITRFNIFYLPDKDSDNHAYFSKSSVGFSWYRQSQYRLLGIDSTEIGREMTKGKAIDNLFFPPEVKELITIISLWVKSKSWYHSKNIPWKRGWLLYGPPGTGKTALVRAFAEDLNLPIYVYSLSQMSNSDLVSGWKNMQLNIPCIALIEDIDNVFHGRKNISARPTLFSNPSNNQDNSDGSNEKNNSIVTPLTFDCLLNCLDGVDKSEGIFTIITTNDISKIDPAIGQPTYGEDRKVIDFIPSRPGRIDRAIKLSYMTMENKHHMAKKILGEYPLQLELVEKNINENRTETPAQFQEYCSQIAIQEYWKQNELSK